MAAEQANRDARFRADMEKFWRAELEQTLSIGRLAVKLEQSIPVGSKTEDGVVLNLTVIECAQAAAALRAVLGGASRGNHAGGYRLAGLKAFLEPWRWLPRTMAFYAVVGVGGAAVMMALHVAWPPAPIAAPIYADPSEQTAEASVVICDTEDCSSGASWLAMDVQPSKCDFGAFQQYADKIAAARAEGKFIIADCRLEDGSRAQQVVRP